MIDFNACTLASFWHQLSTENLRRTVEDALREDGAGHDVTTDALCDARRVRIGFIVTRQPAVCAASGLIEGFVDRGSGLRGCVIEGMRDGAHLAAGTRILRLEGPLTSILPIERSLLNLLGIAMATATVTAQYVGAVAGTRAVICDTRKTIPGLRWLQKYAVRCGGGHLHRWGLDDAVLVKDNHIAGRSPEMYAQCIHGAVEKLRATKTPLRFICAEADTLEQFASLLALPSGTLTVVLLDNFSIAMLEDAVQLRDRSRPELQIEASGGVRLDTVGAIARTGVDRISVGAITHSAGWMDVALDIDD